MWAGLGDVMEELVGGLSAQLGTEECVSTQRASGRGAGGCVRVGWSAFAGRGSWFQDEIHRLWGLVKVI